MRIMKCVFFCSTVVVLAGLNAIDASAVSTLSVMSSGAQSIDIKPDSSGGTSTAIGVDQITVNTNCRAGYSFSISTSVDDNNLYLDGSSANNAPGTYFTPATGSSALNDSPNTWGYYYNSSTPTTAPPVSSTFLAVPTLNSAAAVIKTTAQTASTSDISDTFNIYYGVAISNGLAPGTYKMMPNINDSNLAGTINYYVTMDASCDINTILYDANNGIGTVGPQEVQNGNSIALADNAFTRPNHYFMGWSTNQNATTPEYRTNQIVTPVSDMTLYAVWGDSTAQPLYNIIASLTRGSQTNNTNVITGIKTNPTKAASGVWTYDANIFGVASDASTSNSIYYYRGILDNITGSYGTDGDAMDYPNYIKLGNENNATCWRIVRTTGSGGTKIIYNGIYGATVPLSCANNTTNSSIGSSAFNASSNISYKSIVSLGYTFDENYKTTVATTSAGSLFGTNSSFVNNTTQSTVKALLENTWYHDNMANYTSLLEPSAGYCNDRSVYDGNSNLLGDDAQIVTPYAVDTTGVAQYFFGPRVRNTTAVQPPSLKCPRDVVDLYGYELNNTGIGNQLKNPVALLTADEVSFAGSGSATPTNGSGYHDNSFLNSGATTILMSPYYRNSDGNTVMLALYSNARLSSTSAGYSNSVRPVVSLVFGITPISGSGTATDPWVIE